MNALMKTVVCLGALCAAGCDTIFFTIQPVSLGVRDPMTLEGIPHVPVAFAPRGSKAGAHTDEEWVERYLATGNIGWYPTAEPLNSGLADEGGQASVNVDTSIIVGGLFDFRRRMGDRLSGEEYLVRLGVPPDAEILSITMQPGAKAAGRIYLVEVTDVGAPTDMPMDPAKNERSDSGHGRPRRR